jgi:putative ABC transport system permease protein
MLTGIGGLLGIASGLAMIKYVIGAIGLITPVYSIPWTIAAFLISLTIGIIFGIFPAYKASKLNPIDALRVQ